MSNVDPNLWMRDYGVRFLFRNGRYSSYSTRENPLEDSVKTKILKTEFLVSEHVKSAIKEKNDDFLASVFNHAKTQKINLYAIPFWKDSVEEVASELLSDSVSTNEILNGYKDHAISAASMIGGFKWEGLFLKLYSFQRSNNYVRQSFHNVLSYYSAEYPESFKSFAEDEVFFSKTKPSYATRGTIYAAYIKNGFLDAKAARKIRSDASEEASCTGLKSLVNNKDLYPNYDDLLLQFTDSKYESVVVHLAENLPEYLIASIMGTQSYWAKKSIEERLERIEREKISSSVDQISSEVGCYE